MEEDVASLREQINRNEAKLRQLERQVDIIVRNCKDLPPDFLERWERFVEQFHVREG